MVQVTILHTNDLHGRLNLSTAERLDALSAAHQPSLLLDSGDAVACGNMTWHRRGEPIHHLMNRAGYDAGTLGNREFHLCERAQACKLAAAEFPLVCANLGGRGVFGAIADHVVIEPVPSVKVLVFGLLRDMVGGPPAAWISRARFRDPIEAAREQVAGRAQTAVTVCLSHLGLDHDRRLAVQVDGLDLILGGHSHTPLAAPELVSGTMIGQNRPFGGTFSRYTLSFQDGVLTGIAAETEPLRQDGLA